MDLDLALCQEAMTSPMMLKVHGTWRKLFVQSLSNGCTTLDIKEGHCEHQGFSIPSFQRLERILNDVKSICSTHDSPETRKLYELFAAYGGPVNVGV